MAESTKFTPSRQRLEPYLLLSKSARGSAAVELIKDVLGTPGVYVFAELLDMPNIIALENDPHHSPYITLLKIFSYGTYKDYKENAASLPSLTDAQLTKLKHLSIVSLADERRSLPYNTLLTYLDILNVRELEDLIIDAIYQDVIKGKLDQRKKHLKIEYTMGRDLRPGQIGELLSILSGWSATTQALLDRLDAKIASVSQSFIDAKKEKEEYDEKVEKAKKEVKANTKELEDHPMRGAPGMFDDRDGRGGYDSREYEQERDRGGRVSKRGSKRFMMTGRR